MLSVFFLLRQVSELCAWVFPATPCWASSKGSPRTFVLEPSSSKHAGRSPFTFWPFHLKSSPTRHMSLLLHQPPQHIHVQMLSLKHLPKKLKLFSPNHSPLNRAPRSQTALPPTCNNSRGLHHGAEPPPQHTASSTRHGRPPAGALRLSFLPASCPPDS